MALRLISPAVLCIYSCAVVAYTFPQMITRTAVVNAIEFSRDALSMLSEDIGDKLPVFQYECHGVYF